MAVAPSATSPFQKSLDAALEHVQKKQFADALPLLEQAVAQARQDQQSLGIAIAQLYLGHVLVMLNRPTEAVTTLREALGLATEANGDDLVKVIQQVLTMAVQQAGPA